MIKVSHIYKSYNSPLSLCFGEVTYNDNWFQHTGVSRRNSYATAEDTELCERCQRRARHILIFVKTTFNELGTDE